ncbi:AMP-binding protein [Alcaligenaceae bacterium]|nr:AMP-binding protein [Alcaligenaceae bacterium]
MHPETEQDLPGILDTRQCLHATLQKSARRHPDRCALVFGDEAYTYRQLWSDVRKLAQGLRAHGVAPGDKVAIMLPNSYDFVLAVYALSCLGAIEVPINTRYKKSMLQHVLQDSAAKIAVVHPSFVPAFAELYESGKGIALQGIFIVDSVSAPEAPPSATQATGLPASLLRPWGELLSGPALSEPEIHQGSYFEVHAVLYTSGTTGPSKGVLVSHSHTLTYARDWIRAVDFTADDIIYSPLPLFHTIAHSLGLVPSVALGARICFDAKFSASNYWKRAAQTQATVVHGIHSMVPMLLNQPTSPWDRQHKARLFYNGTSSEAASFRQRFACGIGEAYGATETGMVAFTRSGTTPPPGSCGLINREAFEVCIVDELDDPVPYGQRGEILVRPRDPYSMMSGYLNRPDATAEAYRNLWFHSGDTGAIDPDGYLFFYDRKKDALRRRGENISSYEVERIINAHPSVLESAVIAVPSGLVDDEVKAVVVLKEGAQLAYEDLNEFLGRELPDFMVPRYLEYKTQLPKTPNEKVEKHILRQEGNCGLTEATWDSTHPHDFSPPTSLTKE